MRYVIASEIPGRLRLRLRAGAIGDDEARGIEACLREVVGVGGAEVHAANETLLVRCVPSSRDAVLAAVGDLDVLHLPTAMIPEDQPELSLVVEQNRFAMEVGGLLAWSALRWLLLPLPLRTIVTVFRSLGFAREAFSQLAAGHLTVEVLDAVAIAANVLRGTYAEADTIMLLLQLSDAMERHVRSRVRLSLEQGLVTRAGMVWQVKDGSEERIPIAAVTQGMLLRLRAGELVAVDGTVEEGEAEVNEASLTGESQLVRKEAGSSVFAGTALEAGNLLVRVMAPPGMARIDAIATMVRRASELKSASQGRAEMLADRLVPVAFASFAAILVLTRNMDKALSVLMVDYSCAIKLSTPIAVMSALREASANNVIIKGGKYLEALAEADTAIFDKTGTLTEATPLLVAVVTAGQASEDEILRLAACIEEHFPHAVASAIVDAAAQRGLTHERELHAEVRYLVAHGIAANVDGRHAVIGSAHFVFEDEGVPLPEGFEEQLDVRAPGTGHVYLACGGELLGALCIQDPLRSDAVPTLAGLRRTGVKRIVMLTGDSERAARALAARAGVDDYRSQMLPDDKARAVEACVAAGHGTIMVGDGINDSPALAAASVSVALADASDIARSVADVSIRDDELGHLVYARVLSQRLQKRISSRYGLIVGFNSLLIILGMTGIVPLTTAATLHNLSTVAIAAANTRPLMR